MTEEPPAGNGNGKEPACAEGTSRSRRDIDAELLDAREALKAAELRHAVDREREMMLRAELQHRVRNTLALVRSIFARSVAAGGTIEDLADHFPGRLDVLARYQPSGTLQPQKAVDLETMVYDELRNFQPGANPRIEIAGPESWLHHETAQTVGLALHELATNSIKFGALGPEDRGQLRIRWTQEAAWLVLRWEESGIPVLTEAPLRSGFGREFIEQGLPYQLGAETSFELKPGGLCCMIALRSGASAE